MVEKFIKAGGFATRIKYYGFDKAENEGKPVLMLLHGYLESLDVWEDFNTRLRDLRVVTMDIPGHGISQIKGEVHTMPMMADVAAGVADSLGIDKFYLGGHSMGGYVAAEVLARHPQRLEGIIMIHSPPMPIRMKKRSSGSGKYTWWSQVKRTCWPRASKRALRR